MVPSQRLEPSAAPARLPDVALALAAQVEDTALRPTPFQHIYMRDVFPPAYYQQILAQLPSWRRYREFRHRDALQADGHSARRKFYLFPEHIALLPPGQRAFWSQLSLALRSPALEEALKRKFRVALERRFGRSIDRLRFYPVPMLVRDAAGYRIGIHGDSLRKAITVQFYLPADDSQARLGTILHEGRAGEAAQRTTMLPFRPAAAYAFPVVYHESWHSVARLAETEGIRHSLILTYYVQAGVLGRLGLRLGRLWRFVVDPFRP
jgi:hypothetical protein